MRFFIVAAAALVFVLQAGASSTAFAADHALLVGCTQYPHLNLRFGLEGPGNDVVLMRRLLMERFGFEEARIVTLCQRADGAEFRPTRANIEREFRRLAEISREGDRVVVLLAGHGSQQPDDDPENPEDYEPDGLDEIFLPSDVRGWDGAQETVINAIVDDELRVWLNDIRRRGAFVWVIVDACHSGTMVRGGAREVLRQVQPESLDISAEAIQAARRRAAAIAPPSGAGSPGFGLIHAAEPLPGGMVAIYASQSTEPTVERDLPPEADQREVYGLLSYTINEVLTQASGPLTYRELAQRVHRQYLAWGRSFPTPMVEGTDLDRVVLEHAEWGEALLWTVTRCATGGLRIDAGALHRVTTGSLLAVYPPAGEGDPDDLLGYVRVAFAGALESRVEAIDYQDMPRRDEFPDHARCRLYVQDLGDHRLRVAVLPGETDGSAPAPIEETLAASLRQLAEEPGSLVHFETAMHRAEWVVHAGPTQIYLAPATGWVADATREAAAGSFPVRFAVARSGENIPAALRDALRRIARARNLMMIVHRSDDPSSDWVDARIEMVRHIAGETRTVEPQGAEHLRTLEVGQRAGFRIHNPGRVSADVTVLYIDDRYGIHAVFPRPGTDDDNRIPPAGRFRQSGPP